MRIMKRYALLSSQIFREGSDVLLEQIFCLLPHTGIRPVLELQQTRQQCFTEHLRAFTRKKRGQVINADDI